MSQTRDDLTDESHSTHEFYLPAMALSPGIERVGAFLADRLDRHGVVLIPDTYGR